MTTTATTTISSLATTTMAAERASKISSYRSLVPLVNELGVTYLNSSFAPPVNTIVHSAITKHLSEGLYNPRPKATWQSRAEETRALPLLLRRKPAALPPSQPTTNTPTLQFTRDTTEGLNHIIRSLPFTPGDNILVLSSEHPNHAYAWLALRSLGLEVRVIDPSADTICFASAATFLTHVDARTRAVGLSHAVFHSGQLNDAAAISAALRPRGVHVLLDMTQSVGFLGRARVDVRALGVSAAAFSLHKGLGCPTGLAGLYVDPAALATLAPVPPPTCAWILSRMGSETWCGGRARGGSSI
ncbi:putative aminotransferase [Botryosphaeria dothidea]|uniref:Aminotransferase n=1 Tax=Botryosphaeria dothidea TaxID=55169 RepID=A0A8H4J1M4_9PEZI|nr:putative aminotransferase [Botryosphaeria dothidea]